MCCASKFPQAGASLPRRSLCWRRQRHGRHSSPTHPRAKLCALDGSGKHQDSATRAKINTVTMYSLLLLAVVVVAGQPVTEEPALEELRSAVIVSQLTLSQTTELLTELLTPSRQRNSCPQGPTCPYPYTLVLDKCFYFSPHTATWEAARRHCQGMMGDLATPKHLYAIRSFLLDVAKVEGFNDVYVFVGARDYERNRSWKWLDGRPVDATDFYPGEPNNNERNELFCGAFRMQYAPMLIDTLCSYSFRFLCQYHPTN